MSRTRGRGAELRPAPRFKTCSTCELRQGIKHFDRRQTSRDGYRGQCKRCLHGAKEGADRAGYILRQYGITTAHYDLLLAKQNGVCAICHGVNANGQRLAIDHCHVTKQVRGLLCKECNQGLGHFQDDIVLLEAAIKYLKESD